MLISTMTKAFAKEFGYSKAVRRLAALGFDCVDLTLTHLREEENDELLGENYKEIALDMRKAAEECGIFFNQCHAPYFSRVDMAKLETDSDSFEKVIGRTLRALEIAAIIGAKTIIIHPAHFAAYNSSKREEILEFNIRFYENFVLKAREYGVTIAVENMWQKNPYTGGIVADVCSNPHELSLYVDTLNARFGGGFTACLDIGHCALTAVKPEAAIRILGSRLTALHVHNNNGIDDEHLIPEIGVIDFTAVMEALKEIGYSGELTFEADKFIELHPKEEYPLAAKKLLSVGKKLISI